MSTEPGAPQTATFAYARIEEQVHRLAELREATAHLFTEDGDEDTEILNALDNEDFMEIGDVEESLAAAIEAFISAQSRVSLFISPTPIAKVRARSEQRAAILRQHLGLTSDDDLGDRGLRNAWMHVDETIDSFVFEKTDAANLIVRHVGTVKGKEPQRILRLIDPSGLKVSLLGEEHSLREVYDWVDDIDRRLGIALQRLEAQLYPEDHPETSP